MTVKKKATVKKSSKKKASKKPMTRKKTVTQIERPTPTERTTEEASVLIGITESGVRQQHRRGNIAGRLVGRNLWIQLDEIRRYKRERQPPGRPIDTISGESHNKRGPGETKYQRDYKRKVRSGEHTPGLSRPKKRAASKRVSAKRSSKKAKSGR